MSLRNLTIVERIPYARTGPLKSNYGFLTPQATTRDAAHELGHVREAMSVQAYGAAAAFSRTIPSVLTGAFLTYATPLASTTPLPCPRAPPKT
jgi:hypothetical protein